MRPESRTDVAQTAGAATAEPADDPALHALAQAARIQVTYRDGTERWRTAPDDALREVLDALGLPADDAATARASLTRLRRAHVRPGLPDVVVAWQGVPSQVRVRLPPQEPETTVAFRIHFEDGGERDWTLDADPAKGLTLIAEGERAIAHDARLPRGLPIGYHTIEARIGEDTHRAHLLVAPLEAPKAEVPEWGLFVPTYALHSAGDLGVGDIGDLTRLGRWLQDQGGTILATLPLLDTFLGAPIHDPSPYAPVSRRFWSGLLVDPSAEPEHDHPEVRAIRDDPAFQGAVAEARDAPLVDHAAVWRLKARLLSAMADVLEAQDSARRRAFRAWTRNHPDVLRYARFRAATERHGGWHGWPRAAQEGDLDVLEVDPGLVRLHAYVQWIADLQIARVAAPTDGDLRLHLDLPLGTHSEGYDTWNDRAAYAGGIEVGAPPDGFFEEGQKWGFAPLNPRRLRQSGYRHFAACLRHHLRHASLLRIDHVMGLHRLFWVPHGRPATEGAYVHYPAEEIYAVVLIEAFRAGALVVGEDLGTVPTNVREAMDRHHLHRTYVLQLQARAKRLPAPTRNSLAALNTHDMVPFAAWLRGDDIQQRQERGFIDARQAAAARADRAQVRRRLEEAVGGDGGPRPPMASEASGPGAGRAPLGTEKAPDGTARGGEARQGPAAGRKEARQGPAAGRNEKRRAVPGPHGKVPAADRSTAAPGPQDGSRADDTSAAAPGPHSDTEAGRLRDALLDHLMASDAALVVLNLEDLWLETRPQNQPGFGPDTPEGRHNWSRRSQWSLERITADAALDGLLDRLDQHRRRSAGETTHG